MTVSPVAGAAANTAAPEAMKKLSSNFDTFLTLLTTQLKNQDPTSPMDSAQFTQQLVQFSQVEQQIDTNTNIKTLISQGQSAGTAATTSYLGKTVTVTGGDAAMTDGNAVWNYNLGGTAAASQLTISDASGKIVYTAPGETAAGAHTFTWNGKDANGNELAEGAYTLGVHALTGDGADIASSITSKGVVSEVDMTGSAPALMIGPMSVLLSQVSNVRN